MLRRELYKEEEKEEKDVEISREARQEREGMHVGDCREKLVRESEDEKGKEKEVEKRGRQEIGWRQQR